ncbi:hypothetical protein MKX03_027166 [Papaver bracteatum]|nr:hypothetical protein MKX03_027166 [Papaver bracteatum]
MESAEFNFSTKEFRKRRSLGLTYQLPIFKETQKRVSIQAILFLFVFCWVLSNFKGGGRRDCQESIMLRNFS